MKEDIIELMRKMSPGINYRALRVADRLGVGVKDARVILDEAILKGFVIKFKMDPLPPDKQHRFTLTQKGIDERNKSIAPVFVTKAEVLKKPSRRKIDSSLAIEIPKELEASFIGKKNEELIRYDEWLWSHMNLCMKIKR